jgi:hypothetical protein
MASGKKGPLVWIAAGCGCLVVVAALVVAGVAVFGWKVAKDAGVDPGSWRENPALAAVRMWVAANPDVEVVEVDEDAETITLRSTETGETVTARFDEIREGRFSFSTDDGTTTSVDASQEEGRATVSGEDGSVTLEGQGGLETLPEWVPSYPNAMEYQQGPRITRPEGVSGGFGQATADDMEIVAAHFRTALAEAGLTLQTDQSHGEDSGLLIAVDEAAGRTVQVVVQREPTDGTVQISVSYMGEGQE